MKKGHWGKRNRVLGPHQPFSTSYPFPPSNFNTLTYLRMRKFGETKLPTGEYTMSRCQLEIFWMENQR